MLRVSGLVPIVSNYQDSKRHCSFERKALIRSLYDLTLTLFNDLSNNKGHEGSERQQGVSYSRASASPLHER